jgi:hypothetical protein
VEEAEAIFDSLDIEKLRTVHKQLCDDVKRGKTVWSREELDAYYQQLGLPEK